jgi:hypothetical protein
MDRDGVSAQILYPSIGLAAYTYPDATWLDHVLDACNTWTEAFCSHAPQRLAAIYLSTARTPDHVLHQVEEANARGFVGILLPGVPPNIEFDYVSPAWDPVWAKMAELHLPLSFHARTSLEYGLTTGMGHRTKSPVWGHYNVTRNAEEIVHLFVLACIFDRHPALKVVTVGGDASWAPHVAVRMTHWFQIQGPLYHSSSIQPPRTYLHDNVWFAIADDIATIRMKRQFNMKHVLWCDLYPTAESDWPESERGLQPIEALLTSAEFSDVIGGNSVNLYRLADR